MTRYAMTTMPDLKGLDVVRIIDEQERA